MEFIHHNFRCCFSILPVVIQSFKLCLVYFNRFSTFVLSLSLSLLNSNTLTFKKIFMLDLF